MKPKNNQSSTNTMKLFFEFIKKREQKIRLLQFFGFYTIVYFLMTYFYPYPSGISDSGGYVLSAINNQYLGYRPYGYSGFLRIINFFSTSTAFLVFIQYTLNAISTLMFIFTLKYFFSPQNKFFELIIDLLSIASITVIYTTNTVMSDTLFTSLTIFWITIGIWLLTTNKISVKMLFLIIHLILLYFIIKVRYTGLVYSGLEFILIVYTFYSKKKLIGIISSLALVLILIGIYKNQVQTTKSISNIKTFSGFAGWQMANNAAHVVPYINLEPNDFKNKHVREFATYAKSQDSLFIINSFYPTANFIWDKNSPLKKYLFFQIRAQNRKYLTVWTYLGGNVYNKFATQIMKHYPWEYFRYYLFPNLCGTIYPAHDDLYVGKKNFDFYDAKTRQWFGINKNEKISTKSNFIGIISKYIPFYRLIVWIVILVSITFLFFQEFKKTFSLAQLNIFSYILIFVMVYTAFIVYAAPFYLRFNTPLHLFQIALIYISLNLIFKKKVAKQIQK